MLSQWLRAPNPSTVSTGADGDIVGSIPGGAAVVLDIPTDPKRKLESLEIETLSGDVVIGLMGLTLQRP